jgi:hypothetical protein
MLQLSAVLNVNSLIWISSLAPNEQGTTHRVHDDLQPYFLSIGLPFKSVEPKTANDLLACLEAIEKRAKEGLRPIIHFDTHGSAERGLYIAVSGEFVPWGRLVEKLRRINIATKNNLCVVSAACFSMQTINSIHIGQPTPFFALIAPQQTVSFGFIEQNTVNFYEKVFGGLDVVAAYEKYFAPQLTLYHCEKLLGIAFAKYIRASCMGRGLKERRERLVTDVFAGGRLSNNRQNRRMVRKKVKELVRPNQALIDRYVKSFLIGKKVPFDIKRIMDFVNAPRRQSLP